MGACAFGAPMPEADADYVHGIVGAGAVGYAGAGLVGAGAVGYAGAGLVGAPVASAPAVVGQTQHSYAAGPPVVENRAEWSPTGCCWTHLRRCWTINHPSACHFLCC